MAAPRLNGLRPAKDGTEARVQGAVVRGGNPRLLKSALERVAMAVYGEGKSRKDAVEQDWNSLIRMIRRLAAKDKAGLRRLLKENPDLYWAMREALSEE